jgi:hypothetical protein
VQTHLVDGTSDHLISDLASSAIDVAFVMEDNPRWADKSLSVWSERVVRCYAGSASDASTSSASSAT